MNIVTNYLSTVFNTDAQRKAIRHATKILKVHSNEFDHIAFSGMSGALIAPILAHKLKKGLVLVRKATDNSHAAYYVVEGQHSGRYIIVDDFIASGSTIEYIKRSIQVKAAGLQFVAIYLYNGYRNSTDKDSITEQWGEVWGDLRPIKEKTAKPFEIRT